MSQTYVKFEAHGLLWRAGDADYGDQIVISAVPMQGVSGWAPIYRQFPTHMATDRSLVRRYAREIHECWKWYLPNLQPLAKQPEQPSNQPC